MTEQTMRKIIDSCLINDNRSFKMSRGFYYYLKYKLKDKMPKKFKRDKLSPYLRTMFYHMFVMMLEGYTFHLSFAMGKISYSRVNGEYFKYGRGDRKRFNFNWVTLTNDKWFHVPFLLKFLSVRRYKFLAQKWSKEHYTAIKNNDNYDTVYNR